MASPPKINSLQAGRGIAALMVVLCHVGGFCAQEPGLWHNTSMLALTAPGIYGVDFFFVLSGIVIAMAHWGDIGRAPKVKSFLWKRFRRVYPIYWVLLIPTLLKQLLVHDQFAGTHKNFYVVVSSFFLVHIHTLETNLGPAWTLFHEVLFYALFAVLIVNRKIGAVLMSGWLIGSFFFFTSTACYPVPLYYMEWLFSPLHLLFAFGVGVGYLLKTQKNANQALLWVGTIVCVTGWAFRTHTVGAEDPPTGYIEPLVRVIAAAGLAIALLQISRLEISKGFRFPKFMLLLGDASYSIYLVHHMVLTSIAHQGFRLDQRLHLPIWIWATLMFATAVAAGLALHLAVEKPLLAALGTGRKELKERPAQMITADAPLRRSA